MTSEAEQKNVPWYRMKSYDGSMTEAEKFHLDGFRMRNVHPAAGLNDLPEEVKSYIRGLEFTIYDAKQERAAAKALGFSAVGAALVYFGIKGAAILPWASIMFGVVLLIAAWLLYGREWKKNAHEFLPKNENAPTHTDELLRREWELDEISRLESQRKSQEPIGSVG